MERQHAPGRPLRRIGRAAGGAVLVALTVASCTTDEATQAPVATVERGVVTSGVSATGSLSAITQQNMGFPDGGQLTNVFVKVGDHVEAGQVLATIDDFALRQALLQQEGQLRSQQAALDRLAGSPVAAGAQESVDKAQEIVDATHKQNQATLDMAEVAIDNAERQLAVDKEALEDAKDRLSRSRDACGHDNPYDADTSGSSGGSGSEGDNRPPAGSPQPDEDTQPDEDEQPGDSDDDSRGDSADSDDRESTDRESSYESDSWTGSGSFEVQPAGWTGPWSATSLRGQDNPTACAAVPADEAAVNAAEQQEVGSRTALKNAKEQRDLDRASGDLAIANAEQALQNARNTADSEGSDRPFDIDEQRGALIAQQAAVADAKRDVENATLKAPVAGTVSVINGVVGEYLAPSSGTTALAPGSSAPIPGVDNASQPAAAGAGLASPTRPGGAEFLMLDNIDAFQVVVPFNESDAATISANQKVNVVLDAIPDLTLTGSVLSVAPTGTDISGVISYYVTVVVDGADPRLRDGQTARATIVTEETDSVLTVPSSAVRQENGKSVVTVVEPDGAQRVMPFEPGTAGQDRTQVLSGLREGQQVLLPAGR
ncbi:efflux RND transporter periplasmic adaptor subunit [Pseudonocardia sichuanensis]